MDKNQKEKNGEDILGRHLYRGDFFYGCPDFGAAIGVEIRTTNVELRL